MNAEQIITLIGIVLASNGLWSYIQLKAQQKMNQQKEKTGEEKLLLGLAFKTIVDLCQYYIKVGHISPDEYKELNHYLFEPYKEMGGDGTAERLINEVAKLPIE